MTLFPLAGRRDEAHHRRVGRAALLRCSTPARPHRRRPVPGPLSRGRRHHDGLGRENLLRAAIGHHPVGRPRRSPKGWRRPSSRCGRRPPGEPGGGPGARHGRGDRLRRRPTWPRSSPTPRRSPRPSMRAASHALRPKGYTGPNRRSPMRAASAAASSRGSAASSGPTSSSIRTSSADDKPEDWDLPGGLRMGTIEVTRLGMKAREMEAIAELIAARAGPRRGARGRAQGCPCAKERLPNALLLFRGRPAAGLRAASLALLQERRAALGKLDSLNLGRIDQ